eukprot:Skav215756  [mRNA]  locus=scaffold106:243401:256955:+ [translate_table: standard]
MGLVRALPQPSSLRNAGSATLREAEPEDEEDEDVMALKPLDADEGYAKPKKGKKAKAAKEASDEESEMDLDPVSATEKSVEADAQFESMFSAEAEQSKVRKMRHEGLWEGVAVAV